MYILTTKFWRNRFLKFGALLLLCSFVFLIYQPGLSGDFVLDDRLNVELNKDIQIENLSADSIEQAWGAGKVDGLGRPVAMLSFGLSYYFTGPAAPGYKWVNLIIHIANSLIVMGLLASILKVGSSRSGLQMESGAPAPQWITSIALLVATIWAIHPLQVSTVLYVVQRMTLLSGFFTLLGLWLYIVWRQYLLRPGVFRWLAPPAIVLLLVLGICSKENAVLLLGFFVLVEYFLFAQPAGHKLEVYYRRFFWVGVACSAVTVTVYLHYQKGWFTDSYSMRDFSQKERLLTEARVLFIYLQWIIFPDISQYGLFHDDILKSERLLSPPTTLFSIIALLAMVVVAIVFRRKLPWLGFGLGFYLVGHSLESTFIPLELVFEHRNYVPSIGVIFVAVMAVREVALTISIRPRVYLFATIALILFISSMTFLRSLEWSSYESQMRASVERHPDSARTQWGMAMWYLRMLRWGEDIGIDPQELYSGAVEHAMLAAKADEGYVASYLGLLVFHYQYNKPVPHRWLKELGERLENSRYRSSTDSYIKQLIRCYQVIDCNAKSEEIDFIFQKVLLNDSLSPRAHANLLSGYSAFKFEQGDVEASFRVLVQAMNVYPGFEGYRDLVVLSLRLERIESAENYLLLLKTMFGNKRVDEVSRLENEIRKVLMESEST